MIGCVVILISGKIGKLDGFMNI